MEREREREVIMVRAKEKTGLDVARDDNNIEERVLVTTGEEVASTSLQQPP